MFTRGQVGVVTTNCQGITGGSQIEKITICSIRLVLIPNTGKGEVVCDGGAPAFMAAGDVPHLPPLTHHHT